MTRASILSLLLSITICSVSLTGAAAEEPIKATAKKLDNVTESYLKTFIRSSKTSVEDTWITLHNSSSKILHNVWIEYYACDGEHGVIDHPDFEQILPNSSTATVDTTRKIVKCRLLWWTKFGPIAIPHLSPWDECNPGEYMYFVDVYFYDHDVAIVPYPVPCP
jgi:hypothetical protein